VGETDAAIEHIRHQLPLFRALGSLPNDKRYAVVDAGHVVPKDLLMKEISTGSIATWARCTNALTVFI